MQWAALLAFAVVLPTVSLLWFMTKVVANERLVVQQKLASLYKDKLADATARTESLFHARLTSFETVRADTNPYAEFRKLVLEEHLQGVVLWDASGALVYPRSETVLADPNSSMGPLSEAWRQEFGQSHFAEAAELYGQLSTDDDPRVALAAILGKSRCLLKLGKRAEAVGECQKAAFPSSVLEIDPAAQLTVENARLLLLALLTQTNSSFARPELLRQTVHALAADVYNPTGRHALLSPDRNLFIARKLLEYDREKGSGVSLFDDPKTRGTLETLVAAEELSLGAADALAPFAGQFDAVFHTDFGENHLYALRHRTSSCVVLALLSEKGVEEALKGYQDAFARSESTYRVLNANGGFVTGTSETKGNPFDVASLPAAFPGWKVELYFLGGDVFEKAARRQIAVYIWTGVLVILLILIAGGFAARAVGRQIRLNKMKNDFIATVSHELKTPLASMRALVDTVLEGRVRDQAQTMEYLRLTAKENERLSRMIDNFLTFSRMERNKKAFTLAEARPAAIVGDALDSVQTKFAAQNCHLQVQVEDPLPEIMADHDAVVTVLVNLLDNACKYTTEDKQIALRVYAEPEAVCFSVADNGIGIARRHLRRIFDSFYQVDASLARKAEGCGLGLSIVRFIVDAHNGQVSVDSKPGKGSTFTVRLPLAEEAVAETS